MDKKAKCKKHLIEKNCMKRKEWDEQTGQNL